MVDLTHPVALGYGGPVLSIGPEKSNPWLSMGSDRAVRQSQGPVQVGGASGPTCVTQGYGSGHKQVLGIGTFLF